MEQTLKRIQSHKGVQGILIADTNGRTIKTTMSGGDADKYSAIISALAARAKSVVRELDEQNALNFLSLKTAKGEIMVALDPNDQYLLIVLQNTSK